MRILLVTFVLLSVGCASAGREHSLTRVPVLLDLYAVDYGTYCAAPCVTPKRFTLMYESGDAGLLRIVDQRARSRRVPASAVRAVVDILEESRIFQPREETSCIHCRHWFVMARIVGVSAAFDDAMPFGAGNPEWITSVLSLLGEQPPAN